VLEFEMNPRAAVDAPRIHHPWLPDRLQVEENLARSHPDLPDALRRLGHSVEVKPRQGDAHTIVVLPDGRVLGIADQRRSGAAAGVN